MQPLNYPENSFFLNGDPAALSKSIASKQALSLTQQKYRTVLCGYMGKLSANTLRFAHVGYVRDEEVIYGERC